MFHFEWSIFFNISIESQTKCNLLFYRSAYILYKQYDVLICDLPTGLSQKLGYHLRLFFFLFTFNLSQYPFDATLLSFVSSPSLKSLPQKRPLPVFWTITGLLPSQSILYISTRITFLKYMSSFYSNAHQWKVHNTLQFEVSL